MLKLTHDLSTGLGRLARLADELDVLDLKAGHAFDLRLWKGHTYDAKTKHHCGSAACAVGWCTTMEWANNLGFVYNDALMMPEYGAHQGWSAVREFFGLKDMEAWSLFAANLDKDDPRNRDPHAQALHMRKFLQAKGYYNG